jgi:hypothetical protein
MPQEDAVLALLRPGGSVLGAYEVGTGRRQNPRKAATLIRELLPDIRVRVARRRTSRAAKSKKRRSSRRPTPRSSRAARNPRRRTSRAARAGKPLRRRTSAKPKLKRRRSSRRPR